MRHAVRYGNSLPSSTAPAEAGNLSACAQVAIKACRTR